MNRSAWKRIAIASLLLVTLLIFITGCPQKTSNTAPVVAISYDSLSAVESASVIFDISLSHDDRDPVGELKARWDFDGDGNWEYDFGDGLTANSKPEFEYLTAGKYFLVCQS